MKQEIENEYNKLLSDLECAKKSLEEIHSDNKQVAQYIAIFNGIISKAIDESKQRIVEVQTNMVWDRLVIAFFGSTNAGKSTIIETLRLRHEEGKKDADGTIVGDGSPDFTETFDEYHLTIKGKSITAIDMPGILGYEEKYGNQIRSALAKAHMIFYVHREETKPDTKTVDKIKAYLKDWVRVLTIYNVSKPKYDPTNLFQSEKHLESEKIIINGFKEALGESYEGNISLIASYALASVAHYNEDKVQLKRTQAKMLESIGSREKLFQESGMPLLESLIEKLSANYVKNIADANMKRLSAIRVKTRENILEAQKQQERQRREMPLELTKLKNDVDRYFSQAKKDLDRNTHSVIKINISFLNEECKRLVDNKSKQLKKECDNKQKQCLVKIQDEIKANIFQIINRLREDLKRRQEQISGIISDFTVDTQIQLDSKRINFEGAEDILDFNIDKVLDIAKDFAKGVGLGASICALLASRSNSRSESRSSSHFEWIVAICAILGTLKGLFSLIKGDRYREEAKKVIREAMSKLDEELIKRIDKCLDGIKKELDNQKLSIESKIDDEIANIKQADKCIESITIKL